MTIQTQAFTPLEFRPQKYIPINQPPKQKTSILKGQRNNLRDFIFKHII